jgi:hypothetical protein
MSCPSLCPLWGSAFPGRHLPKKLRAVVENQFPFFLVAETGEKIPNANPNAAMVIGALEAGGLFSIQRDRHLLSPSNDLHGVCPIR